MRERVLRRMEQSIAIDQVMRGQRINHWIWHDRVTVDGGQGKIQWNGWDGNLTATGSKEKN